MAQTTEAGKVDVFDAGDLERLRQRVKIELGVVTRAWDGPHIGHQGNPMGLQEFDETIGRSRGMTNRENDTRAFFCTCCHVRIPFTLQDTHLRTCPLTESPQAIHGTCLRISLWSCGESLLQTLCGERALLSDKGSGGLDLAPRIPEKHTAYAPIAQIVHDAFPKLLLPILHHLKA